MAAEFWAPVHTESGLYLGQINLSFKWWDRPIVRVTKTLPLTNFYEMPDVMADTPLDIITMEVVKTTQGSILVAPNGTKPEDIGAK